MQGKANFLRRFVQDYAEIARGYTRLLKQDIPFAWDEEAQRSFDALKEALANAPLLHPPDYTRDFTLYLAASHATIGMVLAQEMDDNQEHVIYYLSKGLAGPGSGCCHSCSETQTLHSTAENHYSRGFKSHVPHFDSSGAWGQVISLDRHPSGV